MIFSIDIIFSFFLLSIYGWRSPFYLYTFAPTLVASYLWKRVGGFTVAAIMASAYLLSVSLFGHTWNELKKQVFLDMHIAQVFDYFLIAIFFSYPILLMTRLDWANDKLTETTSSLERSRKRLSTLQGASASIQSSLDVEQILKKIVMALTEDLKIGRATIGFFKRDDKINWKISAPDERFCLQLEKLKDRSIFTGIQIKKEPFFIKETGYGELISAFGHKNIILLPLLDQDDSCFGIMIIDDLGINFETEKEEVELLTIFAQHTSIAIQNAWLYNHSEKLGIERERNRISMDMHDSVVQKLFGMRLIVDSCVNDTNSDQIGQKLALIQRVTSETLSELRSALLDRVEEDLEDKKFSKLIFALKDSVLEICDLSVDLKITGTETDLPKTVKKDLYLATSEAISNAVKHSEANNLRINVIFKRDEILIELIDDGVGFDYELSDDNKGHGLRNIMKRAEKKGWSAAIESNKNEGTKVLIKAPLGEVKKRALH